MFVFSGCGQASVGASGSDSVSRDSPALSQDEIHRDHLSGSVNIDFLLTGELLTDTDQLLLPDENMGDDDDMDATFILGDPGEAGGEGHPGICAGGSFVGSLDVDAWDAVATAMLSDGNNALQQVGQPPPEQFGHCPSNDLAPLENDHDAALRAVMNSHCIDWIGYQVTDLKDKSELPPNHPMTRSIESLSRTALRRGMSSRDSSRQLSCKALMNFALSNAQVQEVHKHLEIAANRRVSGEPLIGAMIWRWDSTTQYLKMNKSQSKQHFVWLMDKLKQSLELTADEIDKLASILGHRTAGFVHVNTIRCRIRWGAHDDDSEMVVVKPNVLCRNTASNLRASLDACHSELGFTELYLRMAPQCEFFLIISGGDRFSGNERLEREIITELADTPHIGVSFHWCGAHDGAHIVTLPLKEHGVFSSMFQLNKVLRHSAYVDRWSLSWVTSISRRMELIAPVGREQVEHFRNESLKMVRRISSMTVRRTIATRGRREAYVAGPRLPHPDEASISLQEELLAKFIHLDRRNFRSVRHFCTTSADANVDGGLGAEDGGPAVDVQAAPHTENRIFGAGEVSADCTCRSDCLTNMVGSFCQLALPLIVRGEAAESRWGCIQPMTSLITFLTLVGNIGPDAWAREFPLSKLGKAPDLNNMNMDQLLEKL